MGAAKPPAKLKFGETGCPKTQVVVAVGESVLSWLVANMPSVAVKQSQIAELEY